MAQPTPASASSAAIPFNYDKMSTNTNGNAVGSDQAPSKSRSRNGLPASYLNSTISVVTCDGRLIVGTLKGFDQHTNLILDESHERVFSPDTAVAMEPLGLYLIRGDNIAIVGELDDDEDSDINYEDVRAEPLKPVVH